MHSPSTPTHLLARLLVQRRLVGRLVEVEVPPEDLVAALARQHHLHAQGLDLATHEEHRGGRADGGNIVSLDVVDDVRDGVDSLLQEGRRTGG